VACSRVTFTFTYDYIPSNCIVHIHHCKSHMERVNFFSPEVGTLETLLLWQLRRIVPSLRISALITFSMHSGFVILSCVIWTLQGLLGYYSSFQTSQYESTMYCWHEEARNCNDATETGYNSEASKRLLLECVYGNILLLIISYL